MKELSFTGLVSGTALAVSLVLFAPDASAQRSMAAGYQSSMSSSGPSLRYPISESTSAQVVIGALGTVTSAAARGLVYFQDTQALDYYYYGQFGFWRYSNRITGSDGGIGLGLGVGLDYELREAIPEFLPLTLSLEAGMGYVAWDYYSGFDLLSIGIGIHYSFGE